MRPEESNNTIHFEEILFPVNETDRLHMKRMYTDPSGPPVMALHGSVENSRVFYSEKGKGLGPYLARRGYDFYACDMRGRGGSVPKISAASSYGQTEEITEDIPAFMNKIREIRGGVPQYWIAHSWGGVLMNSHLVRFPEHIPHVKAMVYFGTKRYVSARNFTKFFQLDIFWTRVARRITERDGYLDVNKLPGGVGSDSETKKTHYHCVRWALLERDKWIDPDDGFDYGKAAQEANLPPALYFAAVDDKCLGHRKDVKLFMEESSQTNTKYILLGKKEGGLHDYNHMSMLTHPDAEGDHFPKVLEWLESH